MKESNKPLRICHIIGKYVGGGVESVILNYYKNIDKSKIQFDFVCDEDSTNIPYEEIENLGGKVIICPPYQKLFKYIKFLKKLFKENEYVIVHSNINSLSVFPLYAAKKAGVPIRIAHSHSTSNKKEWKKTTIKNILRPFSKKYANKYFACSEYAGRWLFGNKTVDEGKVTIINNAIDLDRFKFDENIRKAKRQELGIEDELVIGHIGRFMPQKNHEFLIDIFDEVHKKEPNSILLLVGQGPLQDDIEQKVKKLELEKSVKFLGQRDDVNELYQAFDVFVLPSLYEGLPVVGIEAQASRILTILSSDMTKETKIVSSTEFIDLDNSASKWADIILEKCKNYKVKDNSDEIIKSGFDIKEEAKKLERLYLLRKN